MDFSLIELGIGGLILLIMNNFVGWLIWRNLDKHVGERWDKIEEQLKSLKG